MAYSENLINTLGTFSKWGNGGDITATANGITSASSNSYGKSSTQLEGDNTYVRVEAYVKIGGYLSIGVTPGTWGSGTYGARFLIYGTTVSSTCEMGLLGTGGGQYDRHSHGIANGTVVKAAFEYDNGVIKGYINGTLYSQYSIDLSSYSTWYPFIWVNTANTDYIQSMEEVVPVTSSMKDIISEGFIASPR